MSLKDGASGLGRWGDREKERGEVGMKRGVGGVIKHLFHKVILITPSQETYEWPTIFTSVSIRGSTLYLSIVVIIYCILVYI